MRYNSIQVTRWPILTYCFGQRLGQICERVLSWISRTIHKLGAGTCTASAL